MYCRNCGSQIDDKAIVCVKCGVPPLSEKKHCQNCGADTSPNQVICTKCGVSLTTKRVGSKNKAIAGVLAILLGGLGIHKFYLGSWGLGILYLLLCWTFIPAIIALIEGILLLVMDEMKFNEKYNIQPPSAFKW
jgi:TM2 domain-containing membrane protein YozV